MTSTNEELGHEAFMSASELRDYMAQLQIAKMSKELNTMDAGDQARNHLIETLSKTVEITPDLLQSVKVSLAQKVKSAAAKGDTEVMVMRFPVALCTDRGRALNNSEADWPDTLTGRPRQAYELWRDYLRDAGYKLKAMIIEWPGGLPGDIGFFLSWGSTKA